MKIPFTVDEFFHIFEVYNLSVWPFQLVLYALAIVTVVLVLKGGRRTSQVVFFILTFFWTWSGLVYHIKYFSTINPMAYFFGGIFLLQGVIFFYVGVIRGRIELRFLPRVTHVLGVVMVLYSLLIYRMIGHYQGHLFPKAPTFGVPCPTTIFTFGVLLFSVQRVPWYVFIIPLLWSLLGFSAATKLSIAEDYGLFIFGILAAVFLLLDHRKLFADNRSNQTT